jgi:hypothetical protein
MKPRVSGGLLLAVLGGIAIFSAVGQARAAGEPILLGIPIVYGWGEEVAHVAALPGDARDGVRRELGKDVAIGYFYKRFHIFWLDLWTWDGRHVLYAGNECWELPPDAWAEILGATESQKLGKPILYRFPLGLTILVGLVVLGVVTSKVFPSDAARAKKLLKDDRYQQALDTYANKVFPEQAPGETEPVAAESPQVAMASALEHLRNHGIPADEAEKNMLAILRALAAAEDGPAEQS